MNNKLELENKFIQLWNDGKSYDEIAEEIGVDIKQIRQWGTDLIIENNKLFDEKKYVIEKSEDDSYISSSESELINRLLFKIFEQKSEDGTKKSFLTFYNLPGVTHYLKYSNKFGLMCSPTGNHSISKPMIASFPEIENIDFEDLIKNYEFQAIKLPPIFDASHQRFKDLLNPPKENNENILPITITRFSFENFSDIKKTTITGLIKNCQWIFLTGENGYGKSTILKAIAYGLNKEDLSYQKGNFRTRLGIEYKVVNEKGISNYIKVITYNTFFNKTKLQNFAAYGPSRLALQHPATNNEISGKSDTLYSLFNSDGILLNIETELVFLFLERNTEKFEQIKSLLVSVVPDLKDIEVKNREVYYIEKSTEGEAYNSVKFEELAAGYKSVIAMVGDIYLRLSKHQPDVEIKDLGGIVLIDELDVHLHPKWQRALPGLLSKAFPKVQFIASTHSPIPFLGAPKNAVFLKVDRTPEEGITCERLGIDVTNLTPNLILTSPIFGFDEIITDEAKNNIEDIRTEDTYEELKKNKALREELKALYKSGKSFPDELFETAEK